MDDYGNEEAALDQQEYLEQQQDEFQDFAELVKRDVLDLYLDRCKAAGLKPHRAFEKYLEETAEENDALEIVV